MLTTSHPAMGQVTRRLLRTLAASGELDDDPEALLLRARATIRPQSHAGRVFAPAEALGAGRARKGAESHGTDSSHR